MKKQETEIFSFNDDIEAVTKLACKSIREYHTPYKYEPTEQGLEEFKRKTEQYFDYIRSANETAEKSGKFVSADIESWCTSLGLTRTSLFRYYHNRSDEWKEYIDYAKELIFSMKKSFMLSGRIPPIVGIFDAVNNHNYFSTNTFTRPQVTDRSDIRTGLGLADLPRLAEEIRKENKDV